MSLTKEPSALGVGPDYTVTIAVTTGAADEKLSDVNVAAVVRDAAGTIVGATNEQPTNLPQVLPAGSKFKAVVRVASVKGTPATAEGLTYSHNSAPAISAATAVAIPAPSASPTPLEVLRTATPSPTASPTPAPTPLRTPPPTATPIPNDGLTHLTCSKADALTAFGTISPAFLAFEDTAKLAQATPRIGLASVIQQLQQQRRDAQAAPVPACAQPLKAATIQAMSDQTDIYIAFLGQDDTTAPTIKATASAKEVTRLVGELSQEIGGQ